MTGSREMGMFWPSKKVVKTKPLGALIQKPSKNHNIVVEIHLRGNKANEDEVKQSLFEAYMDAWLYIDKEFKLVNNNREGNT